MANDREHLLIDEGDQVEQETWTKLQPYLSKYESIWRMHVVPLRYPDSIYFRFGIDEHLETFAMNNYTAYVNIGRALHKIESKEDDLKFAEEIWANLQRAVEVAKKAAQAFSALRRECTKTTIKVDTRLLDRTEDSLKLYRNRLHDPIPATLKDDGIRLTPKRDFLNKYKRWTTVMYEHDLSDFATVESQLREDFVRVCSALQDFWTQIEKLSEDLLSNAEYGRRISAAVTRNIAEPTRPRLINADSTAGSVPSASGSFWPRPPRSETRK